MGQGELTVTEPRQARSRATMERIMSAVEALLTEKPFGQITIAEISARSASAPTAIYARFSDKKAILLAVHERFRQRTANRIIETITDQRWAKRPLEEFLAHTAGELVALFRDNHRLLRSALLADNALMYARAAELGTALSTAIATRLPSRRAEGELDFAVRTALALVQQRLIFGDQRLTRFEYSDDDLVARITRLLLDATR